MLLQSNTVPEGPRDVAKLSSLTHSVWKAASRKSPWDVWEVAQLLTLIKTTLEIVLPSSLNSQKVYTLNSYQMQSTKFDRVKMNSNVLNKKLFGEVPWEFRSV